jgi:hypothetical protein
MINDDLDKKITIAKKVLPTEADGGTSTFVLLSAFILYLN